MLAVCIVYRIHKVERRMVKTNAMNVTDKLCALRKVDATELLSRENIKILFCHVSLFCVGGNSIRLYMLWYYRINLMKLEAV